MNNWGKRLHRQKILEKKRLDMPIEPIIVHSPYRITRLRAHTAIEKSEYQELGDANVNDILKDVLIRKIAESKEFEGCVKIRMLPEYTFPHTCVFEAELCVGQEVYAECFTS